jgi:hypothetical protein
MTDGTQITRHVAVCAFLMLMTGCVLCPSMDEKCWLIRKMNGETGGNGRMTPEEGCNARGGAAILKAGEYDRCSDDIRVSP